MIKFVFQVGTHLQSMGLTVGRAPEKITNSHPISDEIPGSEFPFGALISPPIMPQLDNFDAWISIDDHPLEEYGVQYSEDLLTAVCWIASEDDKVRLFPA
jgi:hypothetical protein